RNSWTLSERGGQAIPDTTQWLLSTTDRDPDGGRDDLLRYVFAHLDSAEGILVVDETGFFEEGRTFGRRCPAVFRHRRADREGPDQSVPRRHHTGRADVSEYSLF